MNYELMFDSFADLPIGLLFFMSTFLWSSERSNASDASHQTFLLVTQRLLSIVRISLLRRRLSNLTGHPRHLGRGLVKTQRAVSFSFLSF